MATPIFDQLLASYLEAGCDMADLREEETANEDQLPMVFIDDGEGYEQAAA